MKLKIKEIRKRKKLTLNELSRLSGLSKSAINYYEREEIYPNILELEWLAIALDVAIIDLFDSKYKFPISWNKQ
ncbi:helix-turn-helix domain-containing protein [Thomasclavelia cocleata]|uniref:helix-turn-helix domain-containing protein n=1 Tax=Thomasclavelia cocleata TaxID=69824 RepID=UPI0024329F34|nr:helix-turn-helix transcriptional regulator [Thomasclavelia cocleata]